MKNKHESIPLPDYTEYPPEIMKQRAMAFCDEVRRRRSVRDYSGKPVPREVIEQCLLAAGTAPSGANKQPWHFVVVTNPEIKKNIRAAAEEEERAFYRDRAPQEWLTALQPLGTNDKKPFLEIAPCLIIVFAETHQLDQRGDKIKNYYVQESVGIATGMLITAIHNAGLVSLTHTPSPMGFLNDILQRPANERPFLVLVVGYPAEDARVPVISRKRLDEIASFLD